MRTLPTRFASCILPFAVLFRQRTWRAAVELLAGAILTPGARTVASALRVLGRARERRFCTFHRVLSRAAWSPRAASGVLLGLLVRTFAPPGPLVFGIDDTLERRRGRRIAATRLYRDPVRSSRTHTVTVSALRWLSVMLLVPIPWAHHRVWALPFFTALAPGAPQPGRGRRSAEAEAEAPLAGLTRARRKTLTDWARQMLRQVARWVDAATPGRGCVLVADASFAAVDLLGALGARMTCITRLRLDAALYAPPPPRVPGRRGRRRVKGARLPSFPAMAADPATCWARLTMRPWYGEAARAIEVASGTALWERQGGRPRPPGVTGSVVALRWVLVRDPAGQLPLQAFLSTDLAQAPAAIIGYYLQRWQVEVTFEEARRHLGLETQRQWAPRAIARTTPVLLALFALVTLLATQLARADGTLPVRTAAWYRKRTPTFSDALGLVRAAWWRARGFPGSRKTRDTAKPPPRAVRHLIEALCYAA
jgi:hypothetical protein